jgi:SAM-dependent methyltransferase
MSDYLLGHGDKEWARLSAQHAVWKDTLLPIAEASGVRPGARVLEVGCGPGVLLEDLAAAAPGASGLERDAAAVAFAQSRGLAVTQGDLMTADLGGPWDVIVLRWVFSFLPDPALAVRLLAQALAPGGALVIQDYDHDGLRLFPRSEPVEACVEAFRAAYRAKGGDLWIAGRLPSLYAAVGLRTEVFDPQVRAGGPESDVWGWVERFLFDHLGTVHRDGHINSEARAAFELGWARAKRVPGATLVSPMQVTVVGRKS